MPNVAVFANCLHYICSNCNKRFTDHRCATCRIPFGSVTECPAEVYAELKEEGSDITSFEVLFSSSVKPLYEMTRDLLVAKWTQKRDYNHSDVCGVCMLRQRHPQVDITLLNLFFACATLTQNTILDAMVCLYILYGRNSCINLSPKDVYFHFFVNHCDTKKGVFDSSSHAYVADFVCKTQHSIIYDSSEVDALAAFISMITTETNLGCECNGSKHVLKTIQDDGKGEGNKNDEEDYDCGLFVPDQSSDLNVCTVKWDNSYKWSYEAAYVDPEDPFAPKARNDVDGEANPLAINCLKVFSKCSVCTDMMCVENNEMLNNVDGLVAKYTDFTNVTTAVQMACREMNLSSQRTESMTAHYTSPECELNRLRYIHFYSLVKQPAALMNKIITHHLFMELFSSKKAYLCPTYHLACICQRVSTLDKSSLKRTKRDSINKWANKILDRHRPNYKTSKFKKCASNEHDIVLHTKPGLYTSRDYNMF